MGGAPERGRPSSSSCAARSASPAAASVAACREAAQASGCFRPEQCAVLHQSQAAAGTARPEQYAALRQQQREQALLGSFQPVRASTKSRAVIMPAHSSCQHAAGPHLRLLRRKAQVQDAVQAHLLLEGAHHRLHSTAQHAWAVDRDALPGPGLDSRASFATQQGPLHCVERPPLRPAPGPLTREASVRRMAGSVWAGCACEGAGTPQALGAVALGSPSASRLCVSREACRAR